MASTAPIGGIRDTTANRSLQIGSAPIAGAASIVTVGQDAAISPFQPNPGAVHINVPTAARTWTITDAAVPLPYDLKIGEGFWFVVQNDSAGANTITLAVGGNVVAGPGALTVAQDNSRMFVLSRTSATAHTLTSLAAGDHTA